MADRRIEDPEFSSTHGHLHVHTHKIVNYNEAR